MPRTIHPDLLDCLRRPNPYVEMRTEFSMPDVGVTYRRKDQFEGTARTSLVPAASMIVSSATGALQLASTAQTLADFPGVQDSADFDLNHEDPARRVKGLAWQVDAAFVRAHLRSFTARIGRTAIGSLFAVDFQLDIFRVTRVPGVMQQVKNGIVTVTPYTDYVFKSVLSSPAVIKAANIVWAANRASLFFDLSQYGVVVDNSPDPAPAPGFVGELPAYFFSITPVQIRAGQNGLFFWLQDTGTSPAIANVGTFNKTFWFKDNDATPWAQNTSAPNGPPSSTILVEGFSTTSTAIYSIDLGRAPVAGATGRVVFERSLPPGTTALLEISTNGGASWTAVKHGDAPAVAQQTYQLRLTITSDVPSHRSTPGVTAIGIEYRTATDISVESILTFPSREIATPFLAGSIAEAHVKPLRIGVRDYLDIATVLGSTQSPPKLEAEIFLASRHPSITRDKWLRLERMAVTNRVPSSLDEDFTLLSYASKLKKKIPGKVETINTVHTVQVGSNASKLILAPNLLGPAPGDNTLYDAQHYYMRVQKTSGTALPVGYIQEIQGNTGQAQIDFSPNLPGVLTVGDTVEVHSGIFNTDVLSWQNADPADIWWDILTVRLNPPIPPERIGQGFLPRGGLPPRVTDIAPGDPTTQAKLTVTMRLTEQESADELLDQLSLIMGGATVEIDGQLCFVQVYPLRAADGTITVPLPPIAAVFDLRDYAGLATPPGLEDRSTVLSVNYGVNKAATNPDSFPPKTTAVVDNDALAWLTQQDLEDVGSSALPDNIARWLYNTADEGLYLASSVGTRIVRAISTGKRVFSFLPTEIQPQLVPGDPIVLVTDGYTDYDPARGLAIKGWLAIRGVAVKVANQGRALSIFILGLSENITQVAGGRAGALSGLGTEEALYGLIDFNIVAESPTDVTFGWTTGALVTEIWAGIATFAEPLVVNPWPLVAAGSSALAAGTTTLKVSKPPEGYKTFVQVEPRIAGLAAGPVRQAEVNPEGTQAPLIELDDSETATVGTQWWKITERGLAVVSVQVQTQVGSEPVSAFGAPTRGPGAASTVRGGLLGVGEYEHDVTLDATRLAWIMPRLTLSNGALKTLGPFGFDRDKRPNILSVQLVGTVLTIICDSDTKSIKVTNSGGTWIYQTDGVSLTVDVSKTGTNGGAGLGASSSDTYTITAQSDPIAYVDVNTLTESRNQVIGGSTAPPASATWSTPGVSVTAPATNGSDVATINLKATAAPVGWTVQVFIYVGFSSSGTPTVDHTAGLSPALSAPPTVATDYTYATGNPKSAHTGGTGLITMKVRADLKDGGGVVQDTRTVQVTWYSPV